VGIGTASLGGALLALVDPEAQPDAQGWGISVIICGEIQKSSATTPLLSHLRPPYASGWGVSTPRKVGGVQEPPGPDLRLTPWQSAVSSA
ncbi:MAG: hypothetical protein WCB19_00645, partial [Thermoplasmata archaeon]